MAELVDAPGSKPGEPQGSCGFESHPRHHISPLYDIRLTPRPAGDDLPPPMRSRLSVAALILFVASLQGIRCASNAERAALDEPITPPGTVEREPYYVWVTDTTATIRWWTYQPSTPGIRFWSEEGDTTLGEVSTSLSVISCCLAGAWSSKRTAGLELESLSLTACGSAEAA